MQLDSVLAPAGALLSALCPPFGDVPSSYAGRIANPVGDPRTHVVGDAAALWHAGAEPR